MKNFDNKLVCRQYFVYVPLSTRSYLFSKNQLSIQVIQYMGRITGNILQIDSLSLLIKKY